MGKSATLIFDGIESGRGLAALLQYIVSFRFTQRDIGGCLHRQGQAQGIVIRSDKSIACNAGLSALLPG